MTIINRRNAIFGWLAWTMAKQAARQKARSAVGGGRSRWLTAAVLGGVAATGAALFFWQRSGDEEFPSIEE
jgi:hypothetical protein